MNTVAIGECLDNIGDNIAETVVGMARLELDKPPSVAQLYALARLVRAEDTPRRMELPEVDAIPMPEPLREKFVQMVENPGGYRVAQLNEREREREEEETEWRRRRAASVAVTRDLRSCSGFGKAPLEVDGKRVCPGCGVEVPDIEIQGLPPTRRKGATA